MCILNTYIYDICINNSNNQRSWDNRRIAAPYCSSNDNVVSFEGNSDAFNCDVLNSIFNFSCDLHVSNYFRHYDYIIFDVGFRNILPFINGRRPQKKFGRIFQNDNFILAVCLLLNYLPTQCRYLGNAVFYYLRFIMYRHLYHDKGKMNFLYFSLCKLIFLKFLLKLRILRCTMKPN